MVDKCSTEMKSQAILMALVMLLTCASMSRLFAAQIKLHNIPDEHTPQG